MATPADKEVPTGRPRLTPLAVIGAFLSFTELVAGYTLLNTTGDIQLILTVFVVAFPALVCIAFFYLLAFRNYTLFAPHEYSTPNEVSTFVKAMRPSTTPVKPAYEPHAAHALLGMFDVIRQELPGIVESMQLERKQFTVENHILNGRIWRNKSIVTAWPDNSFGKLEKLTVGSVSRDEAEIAFPFLGLKVTREKTRRIVQTLASRGESTYFRIDELGKLAGTSKADDLDELAKLPSIPSSSRDDVLHVQYTPNVHRDLLIVFGLHEELAGSNHIVKQLLAGISAMEPLVSDSALVISDEGDIFGTVADIRNRAIGKRTDA